MNKLTYWRAKRKLTMRQLAEKSGVAYTSISRIENGQQIPTALTILKLAEALEVGHEELEELDPKPNALTELPPQGAESAIIEGADMAVSAPSKTRKPHHNKFKLF